MRYIILTLALAVVLATVAGADVTRTTLGDIPRTYSHYLNSFQASLAGAGSAAGGVGACYYNPALAAHYEGISGQASVRYNVKSRDYLTGDWDADDDGLLFSNAVAVKRSGGFAFGFNYSCPAYRSVTYTGTKDDEGTPKSFTSEQTGSLRVFELIAASRIGSSQQGSIGVSAGLASLDETIREGFSGETLDKARVRGMGVTASLGFLFDATETFTAGVGYRWGSQITTRSDDYYGEDRRDETTHVQSMLAAGVRFDPVDIVTVHASYLIDGWAQAKTDLSAWPPTEASGPPPPPRQTEGERDEYEDDLATVALGAEVRLMEEQLALRAGYAMQTNEIDKNVVPENAIGFGAAWSFNEYLVEGALVRESFYEDGESGQMTNYGVYLTVGYVF